MGLFAKPIFICYALIALISLVGVLWLSKRLTRHYTLALFGVKAYEQLTQPLRAVSRCKTACLLASFFFLFVALAGPQWGIEVTEAQGSFAQTVIAVDVSASMRAQDVKPTRLENAKQMLQMLNIILMRTKKNLV